MNHNDKAWLWHGGYGAHIDLGKKEMVLGMPVVDHVEQVCDGCTLGKQH
jgi:hypothetical protein